MTSLCFGEESVLDRYDPDRLRNKYSRYHRLRHIDLASTCIQWTEFEERTTSKWDSILNEEAKIGARLINNLPEEFKMENMGKYVAITYTGNIVGVFNSLDELLKSPTIHGLGENAYVGRIGYDTIADLK